MAVPLIGIMGLILLSVILFFIGLSRENVNTNLAFIVITGVLLITSGMFVMNEGVQLNTVDSINPETLEYTYEVASYDVNSMDWVRVLTDIVFWSGFVVIIFGFVYNYRESKNRQSNEWNI